MYVIKDISYVVSYLYWYVQEGGQAGGGHLGDGPGPARHPAAAAEQADGGRQHSLQAGLVSSVELQTMVHTNVRIHGPN